MVFLFIINIIFSPTFLFNNGKGTSGFLFADYIVFYYLLLIINVKLRFILMANLVHQFYCCQMLPSLHK